MNKQTLAVGAAPLRISLAGGGSDLPEYFLQQGKMGSGVSFAIDKYVWVTISHRFDKEILVSYRQTEIAESVDNIQHTLVRKALQQYDMPQDHLEIHLIANLPGRGTGLGSSAALTVALIQACRQWQGLPKLSWFEMAQEAYRLERADGGPQVGLQDHAAAAKQGANRFVFGPCRYGHFQEWQHFTMEEMHPVLDRLLPFPFA